MGRDAVTIFAPLQLLSLGLVLCGIAQAQAATGCDAALENALRTWAAEQPIEGAVMAADCKPWPPSGGTTMAAVMVFRDVDDEENARDRSGTGVLAMVDARTHRVIRGHRFPVGEDATTKADADSFVLDTANYALKPDLRALGLRFRNAARIPGAADAWSNDDLTLFVAAGPELKPVFCRPMQAQRAEVGSMSPRHPGAIWQEARLTLAIGPRAASGWHDLVITATLALKGAEDAAFDPTPRQTRSTYRHDGSAYKLLEKPAPFWADHHCSSW